MSAWRWNEIGVVLILLAGVFASVGYYGPPTWVLFVVGVTIVVGARRSAPSEIRSDS